MSFVMAGIAIAGAVVSFMGASDQAKAQAIIAKANADAANLTRAAENEYRGAYAGLQNFIRAEDNRKKFEAAGEEWDVVNRNIVRIQDQFVKGGIQQKIQAAEEIGALSAQASFLGIGGSTVDTINSLIARNYADQQVEQDQMFNYQIQDMYNQRNSLMQRASDSTDQGTTFANMDYNKNVPEFVAKPSAFAYLLQGVSQAAPYIQGGLGQIHMKRLQQQYGDFPAGARAQAQASNNYGVKII